MNLRTIEATLCCRIVVMPEKEGAKESERGILEVISQRF